jgi:hypothetical protein
VKILTVRPKQLRQLATDCLSDRGPELYRTARDLGIERPRLGLGQMPERTPEDVYAFLADGLNEPKWRSGIQSIALKSGTAGTAGAIYAQTLTGPGGRPISGDYRITETEPGTLLRFQVIAGPARPTGEYHLRAVPEGTAIRFSQELHPKGLMKLMGPIIGKTMATAVAQLIALKDVLESSPR